MFKNFVSLLSGQASYLRQCKNIGHFTWRSRSVLLFPATQNAAKALSSS